LISKDGSGHGIDNGPSFLFLFSDTAGYALTSQSRAELMQKLARGDASLGAVPSATTAAAPASIVPSFV
jgi:hypothetical protein